VVVSAPIGHSSVGFLAENVGNGGIWSGRRDLNSGPLAPQFGDINRLQALPTENTRLSTPCFGPSLVPVDESLGFLTHLGPSFLGVCWRNPQRNGGGTPRVSRTRAVVSAPPACSLRFVKQETKTRVFPIHAEHPRGRPRSGPRRGQGCPSWLTRISYCAGGNRPIPLDFGNA
jgi:hypothetical protein